ncbi:MAG: phenylacetate--CoA ligase family protein [Gammaproteobacteria bacterium]|nr:phenylacetate--CoA ligase family protein [Gammaproteobacteria bacterium]
MTAHAMEFGASLDGIERWPAQRLEAYRLQRLQEIVERAAHEVPYYRSLWQAAGLRDLRIRSAADLERLPMVTKQDLIEAGRRGQRPARGRVGFSTRGTSGEPLLVWLDREEADAYVRPTERGFRWAGLGAGMRVLLMSPVWHRLAACEGHAVARLGARAAYFWGSMDPQSAGAFQDTLADLHPEFVTTTAPFLLSVLRSCAADGVPASRLFAATRAVVVVGLPLTPWLRQHLERELGVAVFERGGTQEGAALDECEAHAGPHIHEDVCHLEVVTPEGKAAGSGERGELVVTKLTPGSVFVRYSTGDIAAFLPGACACGRSFRRLKIYGRPESSVTVGGRNITAYDVRMCVDVDPELVGRNVLLVRPPAGADGALIIAIEGEPRGAAALEERLRGELGVAAVTIHWLGEVRVAWGFRQVVPHEELRLPPS